MNFRYWITLDTTQTSKGTVLAGASRDGIDSATKIINALPAVKAKLESNRPSRSPGRIIDQEVGTAAWARQIYGSSWDAGTAELFRFGMLKLPHY